MIIDTNRLFDSDHLIKDIPVKAHEKQSILRQLKKLDNMSALEMERYHASNLVDELMTPALNEPELKAQIVDATLKALPQMIGSGDVAGVIGSLLIWIKEDEEYLHNKVVKAGINSVEKIAEAEFKGVAAQKFDSDAANLVLRLLRESRAKGLFEQEQRLFDMGLDLLPQLAKEKGQHMVNQTLRLAMRLREEAGEVLVEKGHAWWNPSAVYKEFAVAPQNNRYALNQERFYIFPEADGKPARLLHNGWSGTIDELRNGFEPRYLHVRNFLSTRVFNQIAGFAANGGIAKMQEAPSLKAIFKAKIAGEKTVRRMPWPQIAPLKKHEVKL